MADSAALVPVAYYAPARTGTHVFFKFGDPSRGPWNNAPRVRTIAPPADHGMAYERSGRLSTDDRVGRLVDVYV